MTNNEVCFEDIKAIISALSFGEVRPTNTEQVKEWDEANKKALESLWKIREYLLLDDDYGISYETRQRLLIQHNKKN